MGRFIELLSIFIRHRVWRNMSPQKLCSILEEMGTVYVKLGQISSVVSELIPVEYCRALAALRTEASPMTMDEVRRIIEKTYGQRLEEVFPCFCSEPLGAASVAQVHRAQLPGGEDVAVKVQRAGLLEKTEKDMALIRRILKLLRFTPIRNVVDTDALLDEFAAAAKMELDFTAEACNLEKFLAMSEKYPGISCPKVYSEYTAKSVLVMEYVDGIRPDDMSALADAGINRDKILISIIRNYACQLLEDRFFHADPHPGNFFICGDEIIWIDLGLMGTISEEQSIMLKRGIKAVVGFNAEKIADVLMDMCGATDKDKRNELITAVDDALRTFRSTALEKLDIQEFLESFLNAAAKSGVTMPKGVTQLTRGVVVLKSVVDILKPDADVLFLLSAVIPALDFSKV